MQKNFRFILSVTALILISAAGFAQGKDNGDGSNYISGTDYAHSHDKKEVRIEEERPEANIVKFSMLSWISGCIPFYYERRVTPWLGLQFGLGLTTRDFIADGINDIVFELGNNTSGNYNNYALYGNQGRKSSVGVYASFQPKFYPARRALAGFYVSPMVEFKRFDFTAEYADPNAVSDEEQPVYLSNKMNEYRNAIDFTVNIGRQWLLPSKVSLEIMGGVGFRKLWEQRRLLTESDAYNPVTGNSGFSYITGTTWFTTYRPEFNLSFIIGGYF